MIAKFTVKFHSLLLLSLIRVICQFWTLFHNAENSDNDNEAVTSSTSKEKSWLNKDIIELPTKFFKLKKNGKVFMVKCLKWYEFKTPYNKRREIELLMTVTATFCV